jgi:hypothetical protein
MIKTNDKYLQMKVASKAELEWKFSAMKAERLGEIQQ